MKPRSILLNFPPLIQPCIPLVPFLAALRLLCEDVVVTEWDLLVKSAANLKFNCVMVRLWQQFKLPEINPPAVLCISVPVDSTICVPRLSEGGGDAMLV